MLKLKTRLAIMISAGYKVSKNGSKVYIPYINDLRNYSYKYRSVPVPNTNITLFNFLHSLPQGGHEEMKMSKNPKKMGDEVVIMDPTAQSIIFFHPKNGDRTNSKASNYFKKRGVER